MPGLGRAVTAWRAGWERLEQRWPLLRWASIRRQLLMLGVLPVLIAGPLLVLVLYLSATTYDRLLIQKVRADLATAANYFERVMDVTGRSVSALADSAALARQLPHPTAPEALGELLQRHQHQHRLDFVCLLTPDGQVLRCTDPQAQVQSYGAWAVVHAASAGGSRTELDVFSAAQLAALSPALAHTARIPLQPTANAVPDARAEEARGLLVHSAAPVHDAHGTVQAVLVGGVLLNRNTGFVDHLNEIVYPPGVLLGGSHSTATVFLGDVRVATNVRLPEGDRAMGTRVSAAVREAVLERGERWHDRAFVVRDWYVSGYLPLMDSREQRVGMLYVGFLEAPFASARRGAQTLVLGVFIGMLAVGLWLARRLSLSLIRPVERMHQVMSEVEAGSLSARVQLPRRADELGALAEHFDRLLTRLEDQTRELRQRGATLDAEVATRTGELEAALTELRTAQRQMIRQEQLAAIGQLTAGVAHEINNPVAVIQGNLDLMRERLGDHARPVRDEISLIREQVQRIRLIVAKLLQFSRPSEYAGQVDTILPAAVVQDCLLLVGHLLRRSRIAVEQQCSATRTLHASRNELQQVLVNLLVNALQAMPEQGVLSIQVRDQTAADGRPGVAFTISDTGPGIPPEHLDKLFQPFFTTKQHGAGTGLGLWVSRTLVERFGGHIEVENRPGAGASFTVWMP
ncbi:MAG: hypothetical protein RLZZ494_1288 [Pseudomonadota bacterium]